MPITQVPHPVPHPVRHPVPHRVVPVRAARGDLGWSLVTVLLGPVVDRNPDVALSLLACADEAVAAGRARWRRHGPWPARP